jgi:hypothetical protein
MRAWAQFSRTEDGNPLTIAVLTCLLSHLLLCSCLFLKQPNTVERVPTKRRH